MTARGRGCTAAAKHSDVPPARSGSAIAAVLAEPARSRGGLAQPRGRCREGSPRRLLSYLQELGGSVRTGATATRFAVERGRVVGVELAGGERLTAPVLIADVMPVALSSLAGDALPSGYMRALRRYRYGPATLKIDWALDGPIPWDARRGPGSRHRPRRRVGAGDARADGGRRRSARAPVPAGRPAVDRRPLARAGRQAHRVGLHARAALRGLGARA